MKFTLLAVMEVVLLLISATAGCQMCCKDKAREVGSSDRATVECVTGLLAVRSSTPTSQNNGPGHIHMQLCCPV